MRIITNNVPRFIIDACELSPAERADFDYVDWSAIDSGTDSASFIRFKGELYDFSEFMVCPDGLAPDWDGYRSDSFFSGLVIRYADRECESVIVGTYYS